MRVTKIHLPTLGAALLLAGDLGAQTPASDRALALVRRGSAGPQVIVVLNLFDQPGAALVRR